MARWVEAIVAALLVGALYQWEKTLAPRLSRSHHRAGNGIRSNPADEPFYLQGARASQADRGRGASAPWQIPWAGWKDVFWRVYSQIQEDRVLAVAAGVVFYMLLALFPALTATVSIYGLFTDPTVINEQLAIFQNVVPPSVLQIIRGEVLRLVQTSSHVLSLGFLFGIGLALWSANAGIKAILDALNVVYDEREKRSFIRLTLVSFALTLAGLAFVFLSLGGIVMLPLVLSWIGLELKTADLLGWLRWPSLVVIVLLWLGVLYRYGTSCTRPKWQWLSVGSVIATMGWLGGSILFSWYLSNFANYGATYGSLGAAIGLMMWLWLSVIVVLIGGEINAEIEHQTARDSTVGQHKALGQRGAVMADTVGQSCS